MEVKALKMRKAKAKVIIDYDDGLFDLEDICRWFESHSSPMLIVKVVEIKEEQ
jgi:hypothetical protein